MPRITPVHNDDSASDSKPQSASIDLQTQSHVSSTSQNIGDAAAGVMIAGSLGQDPRAVVDSMWKMYESSDSPGHLRHWHWVTEDNIDVIKHLPLSAACFMDQPVTVISELLNAFPDDVRKKDSFQRTALHWAARYSTYPEVVAV